MYIINYFGKSILDKYFDRKYDIDCAVVPKRLFQYMEHGGKQHEKQFKKRLYDCKHTSQFQLMRKLTISSIFLIYKKTYYPLISDFLSTINIFQLKQSIKDHRLFQIIQIQISFLKQITEFSEVFQKIKMFNVKDQQIIEILDYCIGLCSLLVGIINRICYFGRFYKQDYSVKNLMEVVALQIKIIYTCVKNCIIKILMQPCIYLHTEQQQQNFAQILINTLPQLNDRMTYLFLNKYFQICVKIGLKLLKQQDLFGSIKQNYQMLTQNILHLSKSIKSITRSKTLRQIVHDQIRQTTNNSVSIDEKFQLRDIIPQQLQTMIHIQEELEKISIISSQDEQKQQNCQNQQQSHFQVQQQVEKCLKLKLSLSIQRDEEASLVGQCSFAQSRRSQQPQSQECEQKQKDLLKQTQASNFDGGEGCSNQKDDTADNSNNKRRYLQRIQKQINQFQQQQKEQQI